MKSYRKNSKYFSIDLINNSQHMTHYVHIKRHTNAKETHQTSYEFKGKQRNIASWPIYVKHIYFTQLITAIIQKKYKDYFEICIVNRW